MPVRPIRYRERSVVAAAGGLGLAAAAFCLQAVLTISAGCGSSDYSAQMDKRMAELQQVSAFAALYKDPTDDLPVNLRVPISMTKAYDLYSVDPVDSSKHVASDRALPPFMLDGVGFRRSFEGAYEAGPNNSTPYFLYVWEFDAPRPKDGMANLRDLVRFKLHDEKADWEPVEVKTPEGTTLTWQRLHVKGDQTFETKRNGQLTDDTSPGVFELWAIETPGWDVILGWRASDEAWDKAMSGYSKLSDLPPIVAGTIRVAPDQQRNKKPVPAIGKGLFVPRPLGKSPAPSDVPAQPPTTDTTPPNTTPTEAATNANQPVNETPTAEASESENALKRFLIAAAVHDEQGLRAASIANPEIDILLKGKAPEGAGIEAAKSSIAGAKLQHLKVGDEVILPTGKSMVLDATNVNAFREQIVWSNSPIPFTLVKQRDGWKVDPAPLIAAHKAAAEMPVFQPPPVETQKFTQAAPDGTYHSTALGFSIKLQPDVKVYGDDGNGSSQVCKTGISGTTDDGTKYDALVEIWLHSVDPNSTVKDLAAQVEQSTLNFPREKEEGAKVDSRGDLEIGGVPGLFFVTTQEWQGNQTSRSVYLTKQGDRAAVIMFTSHGAPKSQAIEEFGRCAKTFKFEPKGSAENAAAAADERFSSIADESERTQFPGVETPVKASIRFPKGWFVHGHFAQLRPKQGETLDAAFSDPDAQIAATVLPNANPSLSPKELLDSMEKGGPTGKAQIGGMPGPFKVIEREELTIDGHPAAHFVATSMAEGSDLISASYVIPVGRVSGNVNIRITKSGYDKIKDVLRQSALTFHFEGDLPDAPAVAAADASRPSRSARRPPPPDSVAAAPNAAKPAETATAAPPAKEGPAEIEFGEGVTGSITFPAGFQHEGKTPQASTPPPIQVDPAAAGQQPNMIKIEIKKLDGVNYNELYKGEINSELQAASDGKALERGKGLVAGVTGDYIVVGIGQSAGPARGAAGKADNEPARKRIVYIANVTPKHLAVKITAEMADANYKTLKEEVKKCVRSLKFD